MSLDQLPTFATAAIATQTDATKGRFVTATKSFAPGDIVFKDEAFVYATCDCEALLEDVTQFAKLLDETESQPEYAKSMRKSFHKILLAMMDMDIIGDVDRAKCILKVVTKYLESKASIAALLQLSHANNEACEAAAKTLRKTFPIVFQSVPSPVLTKIIGVLNTNSHELETLGGTGLFLSACLMEHNCAPNCSFTTAETTLWVTAIRDIAPNEPLSIDYGNMFYRPTAERQASMQDGYGFACHCEACSSQIDRARAFRCGHCPHGIVHPSPTAGYACQSCHQVLTPAEVDEVCRLEAALQENFPDTLAGIEAASAGRLHPHHYLLFWALDALGLRGAQALVHNVSTLAAMWDRIISSMEYAVPGAHHEKTIYYDQLAQVRVITGDIAGAKAAYAKAYEISCIVSGAMTPPTLALKDLVENVPTTRDELVQRYGEGHGDEMEYDEGDDDDEDDDDME
ncbi:hypothetical protein SPRG_11594 [Saprolegnia parasitica CBS 223.65]|uniref:SET domain-containing protein n=2 Tax=Saprolegnia parasitica (strain CBS 223.65) TaxID=695850 RepID=A0A067C141_SAPPC|nr:hypothetical protein SPRG_11594 [Saprolegnia parasitica CBS 223.65]KDO22835.1 hypothetical protein SPRG_11594 [Saprolegnia parasitica CBS 223.65]|eukprot:XP_012206506.1 hypothetical protein SPRG_11594 [Saprolegnia parasitica CBS 223.65]